jgi:predicted ATP-dependent serine protease
MPKGWDIVETKSVFEGKKPEPKQITPLAMTMMKSLGYNEEELNTMSKKTLDELMEGGVVRGDVLLTENGGWERDTSES